LTEFNTFIELRGTGIKNKPLDEMQAIACGTGMPKAHQNRPQLFGWKYGANIPAPQ
jgi:hypothetical protein